MVRLFIKFILTIKTKFMKKKIATLFIAGACMFFTNINAQHILVNDTDINDLPIKYCELRVTSALMSLTKVKVYVDYGQKWKAFSRQNIMTDDKKVVRFNSAVEALNFMDKNGWDYVEQTIQNNGDGNVTYKYLMRKRAE